MTLITAPQRNEERTKAVALFEKIALSDFTAKLSRYSCKFVTCSCDAEGRHYTYMSKLNVSETCPHVSGGSISVTFINMSYVLSVRQVGKVQSHFVDKCANIGKF